MKIIAQRGRGGFARVEEVELDNGEIVARKVLDPKQEILEQVAIEELRIRFSREVRYQSAIEHPNVLKVIGCDLNADPPYCLLPLAICNLGDEIAADRTLGGNPAKALFDILSGLEAMEERGYVHRDLKPPNVLKFIDAGGQVHYAISDFGLITAGSANSTTLTASGVQGGTAFYAAPELIQNFKRATAKADIYAFGAILHDIFDGRTRVPYSELTASGPIGDVITRCTKSNPVRRYQSIAELREALYAALNDEKIVFQSSSEEAAASLLTANSDLSDSEWDYVCHIIDENDGQGRSNRNLLRSVAIEHIQKLSEGSPEIMKAIGVGFAHHATHEYFDYDYCDVLASKLEKLYELGDIELRALALLALLSLGVRHNRWFVEWKFFNTASVKCDANVIERLITEAQVQGLNLNVFLNHLEKSIQVNRLALHPALPAQLAK